MIGKEFRNEAEAKALKMASRSGQLAHKLHAVTLVRSGIGRPWWEKRTLRALKLQRLKETVVHKNTPAINGQLEVVKNLVKVTPIQLNDEGLEEAIRTFEAVNLEDVEYQGKLFSAPSFLDSSGSFDMKGFLEYHENVLTKLEPKKKETVLNTTVRKKFRKGKK